ncbi:MAG: SIS domain-containing protein [Planctomycetota bacterium]
MCGIFTFVAGPLDDQVEIEEYAARLQGFVATLARTRGLEEGERLDELATGSLALMRPGTFATLGAQASLRGELSECVKELGRAVDTFEHELERAEGIPSKRLETLNGRLVMARDLVWRLQRDLIDNVDRIAALATAAPLVNAAVAAAAWRINLAFNAIDRLEVRGRDSAGIALVLCFPNPDALEVALATHASELEGRLGVEPLGHLAVTRADDGEHRTLVFSYKVAEEVGKIGDNVIALRAAVAGDRVLWRLLSRADISSQILAHTRWASNGVISIPNCHPVDGSLISADGCWHSAGHLLAVLNGDIDNYSELRSRYAVEPRIEPSSTTDAKVIPVVVAHHLRECGDLAEAFCRAFAELEGSMAITLLASDRPGEVYLGQKGSGQGLFVGRSPAGVGVASELYGLVELTSDFMKLDGERHDADGRCVGEIVRLRAAPHGVLIETVSGNGAHPVEGNRFGRAEITTRDIDRGEHSHFLLKEIRGSVETVRKTLRGRIDLTDKAASLALGEEAIPASAIAALRDGAIRRIEVIGQGTAAIAGAGIAHLLTEALQGLELNVRAIQASELSGHHLRPDMHDTLVVAVSQSGTTTDTNRTVDLVRERGAVVIVIVNRRNSDLVFRADGVLYTSDGRDIEMSVASTKAFYAQIVAGQLLALQLASVLATRPPDEVLARVRGLQSLPSLMERVLQQSESIESAAHRLAGRRRHWAVVGSGSGRVAADEIRIKLSELCYKSIAVDFTEDKKHIDLSSEPLVIVCAMGLHPANVADAVKEVAILRAHRSLPVVITEEGEDRFDEYAEEVLRVPVFRDPLVFLLGTMVGHLFGYHAARHFDAQADQLKVVRHQLMRSLGCLEPGSTDSELLGRLTAPFAAQVIGLSERLAAGEFDSGLEAGTAVRLSHLLDLLLGRLPLSELRRRFGRQATIGGLLDAAVEVFLRGISELSRPIDAIKHQAKTVTVGISRTQLAPVPGPLWEPLRRAGVSGAPGTEPAVPEEVIAFLNAFQPLVREVEGGTRYGIAGLDPLGRPTAQTTIEVVEKWGIAASVASRADRRAALSGTKWWAVKERSLHLGVGHIDGRRILIFPVLVHDQPHELYLYHLAVNAQGNRSARLAALRALPQRRDQLVTSVTERNIKWEPALIDAIDNETLFFADVERAAALITEAAVR